MYAKLFDEIKAIHSTLSSLSEKDKELNVNKIEQKRSALEAGANKGIDSARHFWGCYLNDIEENRCGRFEMDKKAAMQGYAPAMATLGWAYHDGNGCDKDVDRGIAWYKEAASLDDSGAISFLGNPERPYSAAQIRPNGPTYGQVLEGLELFQKAVGGSNESRGALWELANGGNTEAMFRWYRLLQNTNPMEAFTWCKKAAEGDHVWAMAHLSSLFRNGIGCQRQFNKAFEWRKRAADAGDKLSVLKVAEYYQNGIGIRKNSKDAFEIYERLAVDSPLSDSDVVERKDPLYWYNIQAISTLGWLYLKGIGCKKKPDKAVECFLQTMEYDPMAEHHLAILDFHCYCDDPKDESVKERVMNYFLKRKDEPGSATYLAGIYYTEWKSEGNFTSDDSKTKFQGKVLKYANQACESHSVKARVFQRFSQSGLKGDILVKIWGLWLTLHKQTLNLVNSHKYDHYKHNEEKNQEEHYNEEKCDDDNHICHFTRLDALISMLEPEPDRKDDRAGNERTMRLYNVNYMNDPSEGCLLLGDEKNSNHYSVQKLVRNFFTTDDVCTIENKAWGVYCAAFTKAKDRLDLWRAYGSDGNGVCICIPAEIFDESPIEKSISEVTDCNESKCVENLALIKVEYVNSPEKLEKSEELAEIATTLKELWEEVKPNAKTSLELSEAQKDIVREAVRDVLYEILFLYKDGQYRNEREYRLLTAAAIDAPSINVDQRVFPHRIYMRTKPFLFSSGTKIIIGPKVPKSNDVKLYLEYLLAKHKLSDDVKVEYSSVKYR